MYGSTYKAPMHRRVVWGRVIGAGRPRGVWLSGPTSTEPPAFGVPFCRSAAIRGSERAIATHTRAVYVLEGAITEYVGDEKIEVQAGSYP